jgi:hypothetical protein
VLTSQGGSLDYARDDRRKDGMTEKKRDDRRKEEMTE